MTKKKLTKKQEMFVKEYLVDLNATQAAIRAGYSEKTAYSTGWENLRKPEIQEALEKAFQGRAEEVGLSAEWVVEQLMRVFRRCMDDMEEIKEYDPKARDYVGTGNFKFDSNGANKALKLLGEHLGMFKKVLAGDKDLPLFPNVKITKAEDDFD